MTLPGSSARPETQYVETPTGHLAYQVFGSGDRDICFNTGALTNLDAVWDEPSAVRFFDRLATMGRVIHYDMRGSGVSDPIANRDRWLPLESNMEDLIAVLDEVGSERTVLYGDAEGGFSTMMAAATYPDRVSSLILVNSFPRLIRSEDYPIGAPVHVLEQLSDLYLAQHGTTGAMLALTAPSVASDPRFVTWWKRYQRMSIPRGLVKTTFAWYNEVDIRAALPLINAPTLVVGRTGARFHRIDYSRFLADHIEGAELRVLDGADTLPFHAGDFGTILDEVGTFLTGAAEAAETNRVLATVMFTDIVDSTRQAASIGDERWLDLLADHDRIVRAQLERFGGTEVTMTGDGCVATFDGPAKAIGCALAVRELVSTIGLTVRIGIHTGEVEVRDDEVKGLGLHIASRVMSAAGDGGILTSSTVKDLVVGSGIRFDTCGDFELKGVPGTWQLFEPVAS